MVASADEANLEFPRSRCRSDFMCPKNQEKPAKRPHHNMITYRYQEIISSAPGAISRKSEAWLLDCKMEAVIMPHQ